MSLPNGPAIVNWLWLAPLAARTRVLVVAEACESWAGWLQRHFDAVDVLPLAAATEGFPFEDDRFDCVVLPGFVGAQHRAPRALVLREARRVLKAGGVLLVSGRNCQWYAGGLKHWFRDIGLQRELSRRGFRSVHAFYTDPSDLRPRSIIPASRTAALAYERQESTFRGRLPRLLARAGLHEIAYPARLFMAVA